MIHTEKQIKTIALKTMKEIDFEYDLEVGLYKIFFDKKDEPLRGPNKGRIIPTWIASFEFGKPYFENRTVFLTIEDETGEPIYFQHSTAVVEIDKDANGKYFKK